MRPATARAANVKPTDTLGSRQLVRLLDRPIAFHRCFVDPTGSITAALMLSQALYWQQRTKDPDGWWYKTREEWREETGMSRWEQEEARKRLRRVGVLREERRGIPARLWYRVDEGQLWALLTKTDPPTEPDAGPEGLDPAARQMEGKPPTGRLEASPPDGGKTANWSVSPPPTITETTAETTTETTTTTPNPSASTEHAAEPEAVERGGRGVQDQNLKFQGSDQELVTLATTEQNPVSQEEIPAVATTEESSETTSENQNPVASTEEVEARQPELSYPAKLTEREREDITAQIGTLPPKTAQQMLDVVEAKISAGQIRTNPAAVLRGIVRKYRADPSTFDPSPGFGNAEVRHRRAEFEARQRAEAERREREREASRITPAAREVAHRSLAAMKQLLRGPA
ncbi:MAG: hypothetical protein V9G98_02660 [Candidatus Competibacter sp.]